MDFIKFLLAQARRQQGNNSDNNSDVANIPDSPTLAPRTPLLTPRGSLTPATTSDNYSPNDVSPTYGQVQPTAADTADTSAIRPRVVNPLSPSEKAQQQVDWVNGGDNHGLGGSTIQAPSRIKGFLEGFLQAASQNANRALSQGNVGWNGVAQALGGGIGGGTQEAINPDLAVQQRHAQAIAQSQAGLDQALRNEKQQGDIAEQASETQARRDAPAIAAAKQAAADAKEAATEARNKALDDLNFKIKNHQIATEDAAAKQRQIEFEYKKQNDEANRQAQNARAAASNQTSRQNTTDRINAPAKSASNKGRSAQEIQSDVQSRQNEIKSLLAQDQKEPTFKPVLDTKTGQAATNARGEILYGNQPTEQYKDRHARIAVVQKELDKLKTERPSDNNVTTTAQPAAVQASKGNFSISKWQAANPNGDANRAAQKARQLGYSVTN